MLKLVKSVLNFMVNGEKSFFVLALSEKVSIQLKKRLLSPIYYRFHQIKKECYINRFFLSVLPKLAFIYIYIFVPTICSWDVFWTNRIQKWDSNKKGIISI